jgi:hypothetical protein
MSQRYFCAEFHALTAVNFMNSLGNFDRAFEAPPALAALRARIRARM